MLKAMARIARAGGTARSTESLTTIWASNRSQKFQIYVGSAVPEKGVDHRKSITRTKNFTFSPAALLMDLPCSVASFEANSEPHTGARPSVRLCVGLVIQNAMRAMVDSHVDYGHGDI
jgi:hypothetical protein